MFKTISQPTFAEALEQQSYEQAFNEHNQTVKTAIFYRKDEWEQLLIDLAHINELEDTRHQQESISRFREEISQKITVFSSDEEKLVDPQAKENFFTSLVQEYPQHERLLWLLQSEIENVFSFSQIPDELHNFFNNPHVQSGLRDIAEVNTLYKRRLEASNRYFGKDLESLVSEGSTYSPPNDEHKWSHNLAWLLGHFHKGTDTFVIKSDITEEGKYRGKTSRRAGETGSGFCREIGLCYQLGYRFAQNSQGQVIMSHPNPAELKNLTFERLTQVDVPELTALYDVAMKEYEGLKIRLAQLSASTTEMTASSSSASTNITLSLRDRLSEAQGDLTKQSVAGPSSISPSPSSLPGYAAARTNTSTHTPPPALDVSAHPDPTASAEESRDKLPDPKRPKLTQHDDSDDD